ncbi:hypothetical protein MFIFM68171_02090 [Madurella fahalii]|uniref:Heterokaryon incompatibility domain-containing protein n=1 Tax=Madurella fahalii TaxID=1157608 RepID=A0ABQ0G2U4_9PEZI
MDNHNYIAEIERDREDEKEREREAAFNRYTYIGRTTSYWFEIERNGIVVESDRQEREEFEWAREGQESERTKVLRREFDDDWMQVLDNNFATAFFDELERFTRGRVPQYCDAYSTGLCKRCTTFRADVDVRKMLKPCFACRLLPWRSMAVKERLRFLKTPSLRVCVPPASRKDAHSGIQIGFPVLPGPLSQIRVDLFKQWLQACDGYHPVCHRDYGQLQDYSQRDSEEEALSRLPTRVIDINFGTHLRLKDFSNVDRYKEDVRYITLSHCWGNLPDERKRQYCLTTENINQRLKDGFSIAELPKTFRDAITMTHRLSIPYLWIDSLCIIQYGDNLADWKKEAARMETVFRNAYCTIAATSAKDSDTGFLLPDSDKQRASYSSSSSSSSSFSSSSPEYLTLHSLHGPVHISPIADNFETDVNNGLLNTRAWVLQERALSARTIHFSTSQAYFECGHGVRCETLTRIQNSKNLFLSDPDFPRSLRLRAGRDRVLLFQDLFTTYSRLGITVPTDRSLAIAGLEKRLAGVFETRCCFGVVERYLHQSLLWERSREEK